MLFFWDLERCQLGDRQKAMCTIKGLKKNPFTTLHPRLDIRGFSGNCVIGSPVH